MALEVDTTEVTGGYRIINTDRHLSYQGVALVVRRDARPTIRDCEITRDEALRQAKMMTASEELLEALTNLVGLARLGAAHLDKYTQRLPSPMRQSSRQPHKLPDPLRESASGCDLSATTVGVLSI
ncbi:hypothetical protein AUC61_14440 [Pseudomonas sp. S25]|uniref:Uncharacterized protein n=1 Tax=Pseudomonas maioricensis TaxID=1766623 RepID=A0ABS9ZJI5_9PSED|nr:hypothetical protein [Pseudomonas sp. S25]MCI8210733.1 hypothetical protein [Pseudomonas sp. S25]